MRTFEEDFMDFQSGLISLCMEVLEGKKVDRIFAYCSLEKKTSMFNAFFQKDGSVLTLNQLGVDARLTVQFLKTGTGDLKRLREICDHHKQATPTEMKLIYDTNTGKFDASYRYDEVCSAKTGKSTGEVFIEWKDEIKG